jgi:hypothetical protein
MLCNIINYRYERKRWRRKLEMEVDGVQAVELNALKSLFLDSSDFQSFVLYFSLVT